MATYFCRFADLLTDQDLCEMSIPFKLDRRIIVPGAFSADFDVPNSEVGRCVALIVPQRTVCHVYRDSMILGSYIIWTKKLSGSAGKVKVSIQGATLESYFYRRRLVNDWDFVDDDQILIASALVTDGQLGIGSYTANGQLNVETADFESGVTRDRSYRSWDGKFVGDLLEELANVDAGFEYVIQTYQDGSTRPRVMTFGYDKFLRDSEPIVVEEPGCITSWSILYDGTKGATVFWTRGQTTSGTAGEETQPTISNPSFSADLLDAGFPLIETMVDYQNVSELDTLDKYAAWWAANRSGPVVIPAFTVNPNSLFAQGFSPFSLGRSVSVSLWNSAFPIVDGVPSYRGEFRMIGFEISVDSNGSDSLNIIIEQDFDPTEVV